MGKQTKAISEYIEDNTIIDKDSIRKALCMPNSVPDSFISRKLEPIGVAVFSGDNLPSGWSANTHLKLVNTIHYMTVKMAYTQLVRQLVQE